MELLEATIKLRKATYEDLAHWEEGEKTTLMRQRFHVQMEDDRLECYTLESYSDPWQVKALIDEGRVWIPATASLVHDTDGVVIGIQELKEVA